MSLEIFLSDWIRPTIVTCIWYNIRYSVYFNYIKQGIWKIWCKHERNWNQWSSIISTRIQLSIVGFKFDGIRGGIFSQMKYDIFHFQYTLSTLVFQDGWTSQSEDVQIGKERWPSVFSHSSGWQRIRRAINNNRGHKGWLFLWVHAEAMDSNQQPIDWLVRYFLPNLSNDGRT